MVRRMECLIGIAFALLILAAWLTLETFGMFVLRLEHEGLFIAPILVLLICWLDVGLFIIAHDAMHCSLAPQFPRLNRMIGEIALIFYAGFRFENLKQAHMAHHASPGTPKDPDFNAAAPDRLWPWYGLFISRYFGLPELGRLSLFVLGCLLLGARIENLLLLWALPAVLSSFQLFVFGTFLPHRRQDEPFVDCHQARSSSQGWLVSLISCYHFGYHHEHHLNPSLPWWRLPLEHARQKHVR